MATIFGGVAFADSPENVAVTVKSVTPSTLPGDGQVTVSAEITVSSSRVSGGITNVKVVDRSESTVCNVPDIGLGETKAIQFSLNITKDELGLPVLLALIWTNSTTGVPFSITVGVSAPVAPQVTFTRTFDKTVVDKGGTLNITYTVQNTGTVDVSNLVITDDGVQGLSLTKSSLPAGSTWTTTPYSVTVDADVVSAPHLTYYAGEQKHTADCASKTVSMKVSQLDAEIALQATGQPGQPVQPGEDIALLCTLTNGGNVKLTNVVVTEDLLGSKVYATALINPGDHKMFSRTVKLGETTTFQYTVTAKDDAGNPVTFKSEPLTVEVAQPQGKVDISITAQPDALQLAGHGTVSFSVTIVNNGSATGAANVLDKDGSKIHSFDSLPNGPTTFTWKKDISQTTDFSFSLVVPGSGGNGFQANTDQITIPVVSVGAGAAGISSPPASPAETSTDSQTTSAQPAGKMGSLLTALLVIGILIAVTIVVLVVMILTDRKTRSN